MDATEITVKIDIEAKAGFEEHELVSFGEAGAFAVYRRLIDGTAEFVEDFADYSDAVDLARSLGVPDIYLQTSENWTKVDYVSPAPPVDLQDIAEVERWLNS